MNQIQSRYKIVGALESLQGGRPENQDFMGFADTPIGFVIALCDGMGGGPGGRTASNTVVDSVINTLSSYKKGDDVKTAMHSAIVQADNRIAELTSHNPKLQGMGTTIVLLVINASSAHVAHVGDSRLYQFRSGQKVFRTADHSLVGELVRKGELTEEQARISPNSNVITRAINGHGIAKPDIEELPYESGDRFALCTDGIWGSMPEKELTDKLTKAKSAGGTVMQTTIEVDQIGKANGSTHDNLSLVVIDTTTDSKLRVKMGRRAKRLLLAIAALLVLSILGNVLLVSAWHDNAVKSKIATSSLKEHIKQLADDSTKLSNKCEAQSVKAKADSNAKESEWEEKERTWKEKNKKNKQEIDSLTEENNRLKNELKDEKSKQRKNAPSNSADIETAKSTLNKWISDCNKKHIITEQDINDLKRMIERHPKGNTTHAQKAIKQLDDAKNKKADKQETCFKKALESLKKVK